MCLLLAKVSVQILTPSHSLGQELSSHLPGKQVKRVEWPNTHLALPYINPRRHSTAVFSPSGNCAVGLEDTVKHVKDLTGPSAKPLSNLKLSELQLEF